MNISDRPIHWISWFMWFTATLIGLLAGFAMLISGLAIFIAVTGKVAPSFVFGILLGTPFGAALGIAHWSLLRRYISGAASWIPATIIGFALALNPGLHEDTITNKKRPQII